MKCRFRCRVWVRTDVRVRVRVRGIVGVCVFGSKYTDRWNPCAHREEVRLEGQRH